MSFLTFFGWGPQAIRYWGTGHTSFFVMSWSRRNRYSWFMIIWNWVRNIFSTFYLLWNTFRGWKYIFLKWSVVVTVLDGVYCLFSFNWLLALLFNQSQILFICLLVIVYFVYFHRLYLKRVFRCTSWKKNLQLNSWRFFTGLFSIVSFFP